MSLLGASLTNLKMSLEKYVYDNIYIIKGIDIDFEGLPFDQTNKLEWIQPRILSVSSPVYCRQSSGSQYGEIVNILFQINIFVKKGEQISSDRHYRLRDLVDNYFKIRNAINIKNYIDDDSSNVGLVRVNELITDTALPESQNLYQYCLAWELYMTRETIKP